jgi:hypothetical protein
MEERKKLRHAKKKRKGDRETERQRDRETERQGGRCAQVLLYFVKFSQLASIPAVLNVGYARCSLRVRR